MTLDEWNDALNGARAEAKAARSEAMALAGRLGECHAMLIRIGYGSGRPGDRPLAGGVEVAARGVLAAQGVEVPPDLLAAHKALRGAKDGEE